MQSSEPIPGNPWPRDMMLTIEDSPHTLHELLWVREAWGLDLEGPDLPPPLVETPPRVGTAPPQQLAEWRYYWPELWESCLAHAGVPGDPAAFERLTAAPGGSDERRELLGQLIGPSWRDRFGEEALGPAHTAWMHARFDAQVAAHKHPTPYDQSPEWLALDTLIPAWRAGLTKLILIPCRGAFTRRVGRQALLLTEETRDDPDRYAEALRTVR